MKRVTSLMEIFLYNTFIAHDPDENKATQKVWQI